MNNRVLVKLLPTPTLAAASAKVKLRPLSSQPVTQNVFGISTDPAWYVAELPDTVGPNPWDIAHARVADQLGIEESAVLFVEPDLEQSFPDQEFSRPGGMGLGAAPDPCAPVGQDGERNKAVGPANVYAWHLEAEFSQLRAAREAVNFSPPHTRIAHIDTGYDPNHIARAENIVLEHSFVEDDPDPNKAQAAPRVNLLPEHLDHGTGTLGILAGGRIPNLNNDYLGGAPHADIVPLRIADSVILFRTSAFADALNFAVQNRCDVISLSMGGLPSRAWNEAVNRAYENGICIVAAAGNNIGGAPSHYLVYPARYRRAIAVCGVMANGRPYYDITPFALQGSWGPESAMTAAIAAFTPNIPWPVFQCGNNNIRENGEGTSSATPQVAAAVALWYEKYKQFLPRNWRRVEAVRNALFRSARNVDREHFGNGVLQANDALAIQPDLNRPQTAPDRDSFSFFRVITGLGISEQPPRELMFNLELTQRYLVRPELQEIIPDPENKIDDADLRKFMEAVVSDEGASVALRRHVAERYPSVVGTTIPNTLPDVTPEQKPACNPKIAIPTPPFRRIRTYAVDPSLSTRLETASINEVTLKVQWEKLEPGPTGEYLRVFDTDAKETGLPDTSFPAVDLNDPRLLAQDGCPPSEGNPAFHQQMVYAVAMRTIEHFERALGRPVLWRPRINADRPNDDSEFVRRLTIKPHAFQQANAFYTPKDVALHFGYFQASADDPGDHLPGSTVYTCLSHDIIAHETTHAILDGMHRRFNEPSNPDVLAFHEAFADIVAFMQHFTIAEIVENEITKTRGDLETESILGSLAVQFGKATGRRGALRDAIGKVDEAGVWRRLKPNPADYQTVLSPHSRGAILVAAVFDAFLAIYESRTNDLFRIYTGGTGVLQAGAIHPDLVRRLGAEAVKSATHVLNICIRALDYIPPVDLTFGEYLRGLITADSDLVGDDKYNYRVAFVEAFRRRGIYPRDLETLSVDTLRWEGADLASLAADYPDLKKGLKRIIQQLKRYADACFYISDREELFRETHSQRLVLHETLEKVFKSLPPEAASKFGETLGLDLAADRFEVHELRRSIRVSPDGKYLPQIIIALTQSAKFNVNSSVHTFRGGAML
ncbi:MAG TPA: S8 family serine peptidase, partial [Pyrinomonadaceae bacterium]|nr:S8 family serine peptidase [Pyrinomonadaceae bacterium]